MRRKAPAPTPDLTEALRQGSTDKRIDILRRIGEVGSISEAARGAGVSYKAAWQAVETLANLAGTPLLGKVVGGAGGGGAQLTEAGQRLLDAADALQTARDRVLTELSAAPSTDTVAPNRLAALGLRTSMRNQWPCTVQALRTQGSVVMVTLRLGDVGDAFSIHSRITRESAQLLGLQFGQAVWALCKATAVRIDANAGAAAGQNTLSGTVSRASRTAKSDAEIALQLRPGLHLVGFAAPGHGLKVGATAHAHIDASAVVIAVSG